MRTVISWAFCGFVLAAVAALAQTPTLQSRVVNSASYRTPGLPGSGVAQGSIFLVFGTNLGPNTLVEPPPYEFPLPTELGGTSISITVGGATAQAIMLYSWRYQVAAILPSTVPTGDGTLTLTYNGQPSNAIPIHVVTSTFGIYAFNQQGTGQAIATDPNYQVNTIIRTFHPGDLGILWGTGLGPITASDAELPPVADLPGQVEVLVGNKTATLGYHGRSGCCAGLDQIVFTVPSGVDGCAVPIAVRTGGVVSNITTLAVSSSGQTCHDSAMGQDMVDRLAAGQNVDFGYLHLESGTSLGDAAYGTFSEYTPATAGWANFRVSAGYCATFDRSYGSALVAYGIDGDQSPGQLDGGPALTVEGISSTRPIPNNAYSGGAYFAALSASGSRYFWGGGQYTVAGTGGAKVGPFSVTTVLKAPAFQVTSINQLATVSLANDLTLTFDGTSPSAGLIVIGGASINDAGDRYVQFQCTAPAGAQQFTIPAWVMSTIPPSGMTYVGTLGYPRGYIWFGQYEAPVPFTATGLDKGILTDLFLGLKQVNFE